MAQDSSSTAQPHAAEDVEGLITKRGAWPDARGRIFLEIDGRVLIIADECTATVGDRVTCRGLTRAAVENATRPCYRARKRTSTITIEEANDAPCQLRGVVAGVSLSRKCFWLDNNAHVLAGRFSLPAVGQVVELRGCDATAAGNFEAGATASISA